MRYRIVPGRGLSTPSLVHEGTAEEAMELALLYSEEHSMPVVVVEAPLGGRQRQIGLVGGEQGRRR